MPDPLEPAQPRKMIRNAAWLVAWDEAAQSHCYHRDVDLAIEGETFAVVGPAALTDHSDAVEIDGRGFAILPGFVDIHAHPSSEPMLKGLTDEVGSHQLYMSSLYEYLPLFEADAEGRKAATEVALCELMQSGVTTVCDLSAARDDWLDTLGASGIRAYAMPMFRSGRWYTPNGYEVRYDWDEKAGRDGLDRSLRLIDRARQHPSGRLDGALYPAQVDTCTEELLRDSAAAARERRLPLQTHAAQSVVEFHEIMRRHGKTPIGWLRQIGVLGDNVIIGHAIFLDHHSWLHWPTRNDLIDLADTGTTVAHCPTVFSRRGIMLEDFGRYRAAGVNLGIGTDTFPHNFVEELRTAAILARIAAGNAHAVTAAEILSAALASFAERGFAATRLDDVAARAGITKGTLYLYFRNKEELFKAVVRQELLPAIERAETMVRDPMAPSMVLLEQQAELFARVISSRLSAIPKLVLTEAGNFPDLARFYLEEVVDRGKALFRKLLERGVECREFRPIDTESVVLCVIAPFLLAALWRHSFEPHVGRPIDIDALCRAHIDLLRHGLAAEPGSGPSNEGVIE